MGSSGSFKHQARDHENGQQRLRPSKPTLMVCPLRHMHLLRAYPKQERKAGIRLPTPEAFSRPREFYRSDTGMFSSAAACSMTEEFTSATEGKRSGLFEVAQTRWGCGSAACRRACRCTA